MVNIIQGNEEKILDTIQNYRSQPGWLCLHYPLSRLTTTYEMQQKRIAINILHEELKNAECNILISNDNDIFIFTRVQKNKPWKQFTNKLRQLLSHDPLAFHKDKTPNPEFSGSYSLDMDADLEKLLFICDAKLEAKKQEKEQKPSLPKVDSKVMFNEFLVDSGKKRRIERDGLQILVVEDEAFSRKLVSSVIEKDFSTLIAKNGADALQTYALNFPDIVFLDIQMPDLNGHQVMTEIMQHDPEAFIVMLSANSSQKEVLSCMKEGAKGFITKPFKRDKLQSYIEKYRTERAKHG